MDLLEPGPRDFREMVEADLRHAARVAIAVQDEIDPQFRIATPEGDYWIAVTLPPDLYERKAMFRRIATFMAWKRALAFTMAAEVTEPNAMYCVGISRQERHHCRAPMEHKATPWTKDNFGEVEWLHPSKIDPMIAALLPLEPYPMTPKDVAAAEKWFGREGKFPAVHIATGEVRGLG